MSKKEKLPDFITTIKVSFRSGGGMGEIDAIEEGLRYLIEDEGAIPFKVEDISTVKFSPRLILEETGIPEIPEEGFPEGVEHVKYTFASDKDISTTETMLEAAGVGKADLRSAVNIGNFVRTVMYSPPDEKNGTIVRVAVTDKDMAWHLQQLMDWTHRKQVKIIALRREELTLYVAFRMEGIQPEPKPIPAWFHGQNSKSKGWRLVKEEK